MATFQIPQGTNTGPGLIIDQAEYLGENLHLLMPSDESAYVELTNTSKTSEVLNVSCSFNEEFALGGLNLIVGEDTHIRLDAGDQAPWVDREVWHNIELRGNSTLELSPEFIAEHKDNPYEMQVDMNYGEYGPSTLVYDTTGLDFDYLPRRISGFGEGNVIMVVNATDVEVNKWNTLTFKDDNGEILTKIALGGTFNRELILEDGTVTVACYLKGTHIATPDGEVKVEDIKAGDSVLTATGGVATVKWLGFRKFNRLRIPESHILRASPIRICKGAFSENVPHRDLTVSPGHRFNFDGALVPALSLINGLTITQDFDIQELEYYHVELEKFDMLLAEGAAAESYLEVGSNRNSFQNARTVTARPAFGPAPRTVMLTEYVQKITPEIIEPIRRGLFKRAGILTGACRTADTDLRIEINGQLIRPQTPCKRRGLYRFEMPLDLRGDIRILSNAAAVRETSLIDRTDARIIGVGLSDAVLITNDQRCTIDLNCSTLSGFNEAQVMNDVPMRWTTGEAVIPARILPESNTSVVLELNVLCTHMYWISAQHEPVRKVA